MFSSMLSGFARTVFTAGPFIDVEVDVVGGSIVVDPAIGALEGFAALATLPLTFPSAFPIPCVSRFVDHQSGYCYFWFHPDRSAPQRQSFRAQIADYHPYHLV